MAIRGKEKVNNMGTIVSSVYNCARCHGNHDELSFKEMIHPIMYDDARGIGTVFASHWALCPTSSDPILLEQIFNVTPDYEFDMAVDIAVGH